MKHYYNGEYGNVQIKALQQQDIEQLRLWRNDPEQTSFLRPIGTITNEMQQVWYSNYLNDKSSLYFGIFETKELHRLVGSLAIYNIENNKAEIGKIQIGDKEAHGRGIGRISMMIALKIGFEFLKVKEVYCSVHRENIAARKSYARVGFRIIGNHPACIDGVEDEMAINKRELYISNSFVDDIVINNQN